MTRARNATMLGLKVYLRAVKIRHLLTTSVLAMGLAACHAELRGGTSTQALPMATPPPAPEWIVASAGSRTSATIRMWEAEKDGSRKVATGPFRLVVHPGSAEIAPDPFASDISDAFQFRDRWYFVTAEGDLFRAASFLGAPVDVGAAIGRGALASRVRGDSVLPSSGFGPPNRSSPQRGVRPRQSLSVGSSGSHQAWVNPTPAPSSIPNMTDTGPPGPMGMKG
jgi:hypothetical protein